MSSKQNAPAYKVSPWTKREIQLIGRYSDEEVARRIGRSVNAVKERRRKLGINRGNGKWFTEAEEDWLLKHGMEGKMRDEELARKLGRSVVTIHRWRAKLNIPCPLSKKKSWSEEEEQLIGKYSDAEIARRLNRPVRRVQMKRLLLQRQPRKHQPWSDNEIALLGKFTDADVADRTGRSLASIKGKRFLMGIPAKLPVF